MKKIRLFIKRLFCNHEGESFIKNDIERSNPFAPSKWLKIEIWKCGKCNANFSKQKTLTPLPPKLSPKQQK